MTTHRAVWVALALVGLGGCTRPEPRVVVYCAQDKEFAEGLFEEFRADHGVRVAPRFDTEADKSVSLYTALVAEKGRPRCDVFWNNEILSTLRLQRQGLLEPYASPSAEPYPAWAKAEDHTWHAFATRARVLVVNKRLVPEGERPKSLLELTEPRWKNRVVMAKPMFGTSATQAACLYEVLGAGPARRYYAGLKANGVHVAPGNKQVAEWVGRGRTPRGQPVAVGVTDTDDAMDELHAGRDVAIVYPDGGSGATGRMGTLFIPNTLAILKGGPNPEGAKKLVDFLLSERGESALAEGPSVQMPLNPQVKARPPRPIQSPRSVRLMKVDWGKAADQWDEVQAFLINEFASR